MVNMLKKAWTEVVKPMVQRPDRVQVAAICFQGTGADRKVLLITSRDTKRWILPKGWPIDGLEANAAAAQEAWEEAGVKAANINPEPLGSYDYDKRMDGGGIVSCATQVFAVEVDHLEDSFPEAQERTRKWVKPREAAEMVDEPGLQAILQQF
ncbi:NUDIX hydrolase [Planktotalea sp.]|jgi:8-oxo-dGTP pyrophosphatase MutT (NUDIX family)|uniref:NUDIX hydrolase n=1 Tax=Planktotalea sp. TaxID=2029877 RepID=UPI003F6B7B59